MPYDSFQVANAFLELAKNESVPLTNMQLQKLVFLAQGYSLALLNEPITYHNIHAWTWGPVLPKLYKQFKDFGSGTINRLAASSEEVVPKDSPEYGVILGVWRKFGHMNGGQLSSLTHEVESPWEITWKLDKFGIIPPALIGKFYKAQFHGS